MTILITGVAGFIGAHVAHLLLARGDTVVGMDNLNDYYDPALKKARLKHFCDHENFRFEQIDISDQDDVATLFEQVKPTHVINLAAQAGVRYSITHPQTYIDSNIQGFLNILEGCRNTGVEHLVFASSSSVYGANTKTPFSVSDGVDHPISLYAATKKSNELMAHTYAHLYQIPVTGLRFFTVYGPWGRPDMAPFLFANNIIAGTPINVFNNGEHARDFTYIDDIAEGVIRCLDKIAIANPKWDSANPYIGSSSAPYRIYNIGNNHPIELMDFIAHLERAIGKEAKKNFLPIQPGDIRTTFADVKSLEDDIGYRANTSIKDGVDRFIKWYQGYYST